MKTEIENGKAKVGQSIQSAAQKMIEAFQVSANVPVSLNSAYFDLKQSLKEHKTQTFSQKLEALKSEVLQGYADFFRNDNAICDLRLVNTCAACENENVEILGAFVTKGRNVSLIGQNSDGNEFYQPINECLVNDLIYVLEELHQKNYDQC